MNDPKSQLNSRQLLAAIFFEASMATNEDKLQLKPDLDKAKPDPDLQGAERETVDAKLAELTGILTKIGLEDVKSRLKVDRAAFRLASTQDQHKTDSDVLFDFAQIGPLIDKGYVAIDAESDGKDFAIIILAADSMPDMDIPDADDPNAVEFDNGKEESGIALKATAVELAEQLVQIVLRRD
jgi:hypothetical protein